MQVEVVRDRGGEVHGREGDEHLIKIPADPHLFKMKASLPSFCFPCGGWLCGLPEMLFPNIVVVIVDTIVSVYIVAVVFIFPWRKRWLVVRSACLSEMLPNLMLCSLCE